MTQCVTMTGFNRYALTAIREAKGVSKASLAKAIGVDRTYVTRFENGERPPNDQQVKAMAQALNISPLVLTGVLIDEGAAA